MFETSIIYLVSHCKLCKTELSLKEIEVTGKGENPTCENCTPFLFKN